MANADRHLDRRAFLKKTAASAVGVTIVAPSAVRGSQANSRLELGVIGSGGRGRFVATLFEKHTNTKVVALHDYFADRVQCGFGIGTDLSNDMGVPALNIVMKLTECNGQPVAKLSDTPGKTLCTDETFLAYLRQVFKQAA